MVSFHYRKISNTTEIFHLNSKLPSPATEAVSLLILMILCWYAYKLLTLSNCQKLLNNILYFQNIKHRLISLKNNTYLTMDGITSNTNNLKIIDNSKTVTSFINLDSDDNDDDSNIEQPPKLPAEVTVVKRIAKKSTVSIDYRQPPAAATRRQVALANKQKSSVSYDRFMENFDPESSARERRKLTRKVNSVSLVRKIPGALYDENGAHLASGYDLCDCLQQLCSGCHFPCPKCGSQKCGIECRCNRKYVYDLIEYHGCDYVVKNPNSIK